MAITQCPQGHIYDTNIYSACPYCAGNASLITFDRPSRMEEPGEQMTPAGDLSGPGATVAPSGYSPAPGATVAPSGYSSAPGATVAPSGYSVAPGATVAPSGFSGRPGRTVPIGGLGDAGKTVTPQSLRGEAAQDKVPAPKNRGPVVGWLVCARGPGRGGSFELYAGENTIGRSRENDLCLAGDETVPAESCAVIEYDPRYCDFCLLPDEQLGDVCLGGEPLYVPARLQAYDRIEIGRTQLVFVPLCGGQFRWEDGYALA